MKMGALARVAPGLAAGLALWLAVLAGLAWADSVPDTCAQEDQLVCACPDGTGSAINSLVAPCFLGDVNRAVVTQADPFGNAIFSALNWPATGTRGQPDPGRTPKQAASAGSGDYATVWDSWPDTRALFRRDLKAPAPWDSATTPLPAACTEAVAAAGKAAGAWAQVPQGAPVHVLDDYIDPDGHALIDRSGQPVRYQILFNRQAFDYVRDNGFWDPATLAAYLSTHDSIDFPMGEWDPGRRGAVIIKAAWKLLDEAEDDPAHFHKAWAFVSPVVRDGKVLRADCELQPVGLVGLHVIAKTVQFRNWLWATFDHVAAAPGWEEFPAIAAGRSNPYAAFGEAADPDSDKTFWIFFSPQESECFGDCPPAALVNQALAKDGASPELPTEPSRITKAQPRGYYYEVEAGAAADDANADCPDTLAENDVRSYNRMDCLMLAGFGGTALQYYQLKGTQWFAAESRVPEPDVLANTVLEAFSQAQSSCLACHAESGPADAEGRPDVYDFVFTMGRPPIDVFAVPAPLVLPPEDPAP